MQTTLRRSGFKIAPSFRADRLDIARHVFGDVDVAKTLVHNVSSREGALDATDAWVETLARDGQRNTGNPGHIGMWTIRDTVNGGAFVGIRGVFVAPGLPDNTVATFVAVARPYWGRGVSSESSRLLCGNVFESSEVNAIYTRVWPELNPASDAVQRKLGFEPAERHTLKATFGEKRMNDVLEFDLWRASELDVDGYQEPLRQVSIRIGQLSAEDLLDLEQAQQRILNALPETLARTDAVQALIHENLQLGLRNPAWASYRMSRANWAARNGE